VNFRIIIQIAAPALS